MLLRVLFEKAIIEVMVIDHTKSFESIPRDKGARHATDEQGNGIDIQYLIDQPFDSWVTLGFLAHFYRSSFSRNTLLPQPIGYYCK